MKATLEFNLPEDQDDFQKASRANDLHYAIWEFDQWLRSQTKYAPDTMSKDSYDAYDDCRERLYQFLNENNVNFN
jgi:hypothetical protein